MSVIFSLVEVPSNSVCMIRPLKVFSCVEICFKSTIVSDYLSLFMQCTIIWECEPILPKVSIYDTFDFTVTL